MAFLAKDEVDMEVRSNGSSGQWCLRSGVGGLKHIVLRILWLQRGVKKHVFKIKPIPKLNIADLNTKKMSVQRRKFLLFLIRAVTKERREVPAGAEEMAEHMSSVALSHQIRRLKQVGRTTKNSRLLFTTCFIQMVTGSRGQPREFIKETYVYVEAASLWMCVLTLLVMMILFVQFLSMCGSRSRTQAGTVQEPEQEPDGAQSTFVYGTPDVETENESERENEDEEENEDEGENEEEVPAPAEVQEQEDLPMQGNVNFVVTNEPEGDPEPGPAPQQAAPVQPPPVPVQQPQGVRLRVRLEYAVVSGRQGCMSLNVARRIAEYTMDVHRRLRYRRCQNCNPTLLPDP